MDVKELFDNAENGTLTYDEFVKATAEKKMKLVDLSEGNYVGKQKFDDEISSRDTRITELSDTISTRDADLTALRTQLETAGTDADKLSTVTSDLDKLQKQYEKDTKDLQKKLEAQAYEFAVREFVGTQQFTSEAAKRDFTSQMKAKKLQMEGDTIIGATDFVEVYKQNNADAFKVEAPAEPDTMDEQKKPKFAGPTQPDNSQTSANPFQFNFLGVRPH